MLEKTETVQSERRFLISVDRENVRLVLGDDLIFHAPHDMERVQDFAVLAMLPSMSKAILETIAHYKKRFDQ